MNCLPIAPSASKALGLSWPTLELAGVETEPDMPPEPCCLTEYFSDMMNIRLVRSELVYCCVDSQVVESTACLVCGFYINVSTAENNLIICHDEVDDDPLTAAADA